MTMYRHDSLYRQKGQDTSSVNLDSTIPSIIYIYFTSVYSIVRFSSTFIQLKTKDETFPGYEFITFN